MPFSEDTGGQPIGNKLRLYDEVNDNYVVLTASDGLQVFTQNQEGDVSNYDGGYLSLGYIQTNVLQLGNIRVVPYGVNGILLGDSPFFDTPLGEDLTNTVIAGVFIDGELQGPQPDGSQSGYRFVTETHGYEFRRGTNGTMVWCRFVKG